MTSFERRAVLARLLKTLEKKELRSFFHTKVTSWCQAHFVFTIANNETTEGGTKVPSNHLATNWRGCFLPPKTGAA
jgi:hypothetical protein